MSTDVFDADLDSEDADTAYVFDDPDELHRVRRLRQIHDARERFNEVRLKGRTLTNARNDFGTDAYDDVCAVVAMEYLRELEPLITRSDSDLLERTVTIENQTLTLAQLLDHDGSVTWEQEIDVSGRGRGTRTDTRTYHATMDAATSLRVARLCDDFLADVMPAGLTTDDNSKWEI